MSGKGSRDRRPGAGRQGRQSPRRGATASRAAAAVRGSRRKREPGGTLIVRVANALRQPLPDRMDVRVIAARTDTLVRLVTDVPGDAAVRIEGLVNHQPYLVNVFPARHRPVAAFGIPMPGAAVPLQLHTPLDPERVRAATFPAYHEIDEALRSVLESSTVEGIAGSGAQLYQSLTDTQRAGMFNLFAKMGAFGFDERRSIWTFVERLYRIRADRVFADVAPALRDLVKSAVAEERFREVSGTLHTPPPHFVPAGSYKTAERYGNLQLTFFASQGEPLAFKVDADIDDAAGLGHAFQVIRHFVTGGATHPYDIHQILVFRQEVVLPYQLA